MGRIPNRFASRAVAIAALAIGVAGVALSDEPPPADNPAVHGDHHHDPAWGACKKQADDQKLQPGDARREFMKACLKSAKAAPPQP
jgi:hypothetical protein